MSIILMRFLILLAKIFSFADSFMSKVNYISLINSIFNLFISCKKERLKVGHFKLSNLGE